ncbi:MAG: tyrosine-type recombinase/integrase [Sphingobium sp.]
MPVDYIPTIINHRATLINATTFSGISFFNKEGLAYEKHRSNLNALINIYITSPEWARLSDRTRYVWGLIVERIRIRWGTTQISLWSDPLHLQAILAWRNEFAHQPRTADHQLTVLHHMLAWARLHGWVTTNIATGIPRLYRPGTRAEIIWHCEEVDRFCSAAPQHIRDGMRLAAATGLRRADLVALTWSEVERFSIKRVTLKSGRRRKRAIIPVTPQLNSLLEELKQRARLPHVETVLVNSRGQSWSEDGFSHRFNVVRDALDIRHTDGRKKHLHDVRGTYATQLVKLGLSDQEVGDIMGWSAQQVGDIRKIYVDDETAIQSIIQRMTMGQQ